MVAAVVLRAQREPVRLEQVQVHDPGPGQVRVRLAAVGVCHSDLSLADGTMAQKVPAVLGHEGAGHVVAVGEGVTAVAVGDPVVLDWSPACHDCWFCEHGEPWLCTHASDAWDRTYATAADGAELRPGLGTGAFAEETVVPERGCVRLPADADLQLAALLGCAVLTGVGAVRNAARVSPGESVLVTGLGGVGLSAVQGARLAGAGQVIAVDTAADREELARRCGATDFLLAGDDLPKRVRALTGGRGADHAVECVGRAATIRAARSATRRGGTTTVVGIGPRDEQVALNPLEIFHFARRLQGCVYGNGDPQRDVPELLAAAAEGQLDLDALVTRRIGLADVPDALAAMRAGTAPGRTLVVLDGR